jgi:phage terminase small subunit
MVLTPKQEKFAVEYVKSGDKSAAYRLAYNAENMGLESVNVEACKLSSTPNVSLRIDELRKTLEDKGLYTLEQSIQKDLNLIQMYENALNDLQNEGIGTEKVLIAERTIKHIGAGGYSSAQDRLAKKHGWFEKDNMQTNTAPIIKAKVKFVRKRK